MSAAPLALACKLDDLKQLDNKPYIKFQTHLLNHVLDELPRTLAVLYEKLYINQKTDKRHSRGVIMSQRQIGKLIRRHESTAYRQLKQLEALGYIRKTPSKHSKNLYCNQLCYEVIAPEEILSGIKNNVLDITKNNTLYKRSPAKTHEDLRKNAEHINNNRNKVPIIKTNIREEILIDNFEPVFDAVVLPSVVPCETSGVQFEPVVGVVEPQAKVARLITKAEKVEVVKKVKAMLKAGEIHPKVQANYQDIMVLVQHVIIHCVYRNVLRCKTFKHALNFAAKAIRNGTWTTPKRIVQAEINHREQQAREANELELRKSLGSGLGKILGEAVRVQNGLSDADIAKAKAAILEHGIRELGANATKNDIDALKTILQKSIDRKRSKSRE